MELEQANESLPPINEIYGPTIQGEGPDIGRPCLFLRVHNCPVQCKFCDTAFSWDGSEKGKKMSCLEAQKKLIDLSQGTKNIGLVLSGGEPLLYYKSESLKRLLHGYAWMGLETSGFIGTVQPDISKFQQFLSKFTTISLSPKITPCLHGHQSDKDLECNFHLFEQRWSVVLKFVVRDDRDIYAIQDFRKRHPSLSQSPTYIMPYGQEREEILEILNWMVPIAAREGFIITPRLHSILWGKQRRT